MSIFFCYSGFPGIAPPYIFNFVRKDIYERPDLFLTHINNSMSQKH